MNVTFDTARLLEAFSAAAAVAPTRDRSGAKGADQILLAGDASNWTLTGAGKDMTVSASLGCVACDEFGPVLLPPGRFRQILATCPHPEISLSAEREEISIRAGRSKYTLPRTDPARFPEPPRFPDGPYLSFDAADLTAAFRRTVFSCDDESTRYALGGVMIEVDRGSSVPGVASVNFVATDGRRLSLATAPASVVGSESGAEVDIPPGTVLPLKALRLLLESSPAEGAKVDVSVTAKTSVTFRDGPRLILARLVEGRFPDYRTVFPSSASVSVRLDVGPFREAVEQASILTSDEARGVRFRFADGVLEMTSKAPDVGRSKVSLPVPHAGPAVEVSYDPGYLLDALRAVDPESAVTAEVHGKDNGTVFRFDSGQPFAYVVMPLTGDERTP